MTEPDRSWTQTVNEAEAREEARQRERMQGNRGWDDGLSLGSGCSFVLLLAFLIFGAALLLVIAPGLDCASEGDPDSYRGTAVFSEPVERCGNRQSEPQ